MIHWKESIQFLLSGHIKTYFFLFDEKTGLTGHIVYLKKSFNAFQHITLNMIVEILAGNLVRHLNKYLASN